MSGFVSYTSFDPTVTKIVPVIASFDTTGHVVPLYVRIDRVSYKILSFFVNVRYSNITEFKCTVEDSGTEKPLELSYYSTEGMWTMHIG